MNIYLTIVNKNNEPIYGVKGSIIASHKEIDRVENGLVYFKETDLTTPDLRHLMKEPIDVCVKFIDVFSNNPTLYITISKESYEELLSMDFDFTSRDTLSSWGFDIDVLSKYEDIVIMEETSLESK